MPCCWTFSLLTCLSHTWLDVISPEKFMLKKWIELEAAEWLWWKCLFNVSRARSQTVLACLHRDRQGLFAGYGAGLLNPYSWPTTWNKCGKGVHKSFCTFQCLHALHADECVSLAVDHEVQDAAVKEEGENKVLFSGLLRVPRYNCTPCNPSWQTWGTSHFRNTEEEYGNNRRRNWHGSNQIVPLIAETLSLADPNKKQRQRPGCIHWGSRC